jgi:hypothetical protein
MMNIRAWCPKDIFMEKGRCLVMQSAHPWQTGLTGVAVGLVVQVSKIVKAKIDAWRKFGGDC